MFRLTRFPGSIRGYGHPSSLWIKAFCAAAGPSSLENRINVIIFLVLHKVAEMLMSPSTGYFEENIPTENFDSEGHIWRLWSHVLHSNWECIIQRTVNTAPWWRNLNNYISIFQGVSLVNQHKMVNKALEEEIKQMHGLTLNTKACPPWGDSALKIVQRHPPICCHSRQCHS